MSEKMEGCSITMEPVDWAVVQQIAKDMGLSSRSASVRFIIRDWQRLKTALELHRPASRNAGQPHAPAIHVPAAAAQPEEV